MRRPFACGKGDESLGVGVIVWCDALHSLWGASCRKQLTFKPPKRPPKGLCSLLGSASGFVLMLSSPSRVPAAAARTVFPYPHRR